MSLRVVEAIGALESQTLLPPLPRGFNLLRCGLGLGEGNYLTVNRLRIGARQYSLGLKFVAVFGGLAQKNEGYL